MSSDDADARVATFVGIDSAHASTASSVGEAPRHISQLVVQQQYLVILATFSEEVQAREKLDDFRKVIPGATIVRGKSTYWIVATSRTSSISEAARLADQVKKNLEAQSRGSLNYSVKLLPVQSPRR